MRYIPKYNEQNFSPAEVKAGMVTKFVDFLLKQDIDAEAVRQPGELAYFTNINITSDGEMDVTVQWCQVVVDPYIPSGQFEFVGEDECVKKIRPIQAKETSTSGWEKYAECADCPQEKGENITCEECEKFNTSSTAAAEDYDLVVCTAKEDTNCDNDCDNCTFNSSNQSKEN